MICIFDHCDLVRSGMNSTWVQMTNGAHIDAYQRRQGARHEDDTLKSTAGMNIIDFNIIYIEY